MNASTEMTATTAVAQRLVPRPDAGVAHGAEVQFAQFLAIRDREPQGRIDFPVVAPDGPRNVGRLSVDLLKERVADAPVVVGVPAQLGGRVALAALQAR